VGDRDGERQPHTLGLHTITKEDIMAIAKKPAVKKVTNKPKKAAPKSKKK
jgi:hypothetical protein